MVYGAAAIVGVATAAFTAVSQDEMKALGQFFSQSFSFNHAAARDGLDTMVLGGLLATGTTFLTHQGISIASKHRPQSQL